MNPKPIFLYRNGTRVGPLPFEEVAQQVANGTLSPSDLAWQEGMADWQTLESVLQRPITTLSAPPPPPPPGSVPRSSSAPEETLIVLYPSLWNWWLPLSMSVVAIVGSVLWSWYCLFLSFVLISFVFGLRSSTRYTVTNRRVLIEQGIGSRTSRELRISDIRSINIRKNVFKMGMIEFTSAARGEADVIFTGIWDVDKVHETVLRFQ